MLNHRVSFYICIFLNKIDFYSNICFNYKGRNGDIPLSVNDTTTPNEDGENIDLRNHFDGRLDVIFSDGDRRIDVDQFWEMNYHEASIFLEVSHLIKILIVTIYFIM